MFPASSSINISYPFGSVRIKWSACAALAASITSSSVASGFPYLILSLILPPNSHVSCKTIPNILRNSPRLKSFTL